MILFPPQLCDLLSYLLSLQLLYSPLLIQILARCDATDHTRCYWSTLVAVGRHGVLLAPSGVSAFFFFVLRFSASTRQRPHMKGFGVFERPRDQFTPWLSYTKASLSLPSSPKKLVWRVRSVINSFHHNFSGASCCCKTDEMDWGTSLGGGVKGGSSCTEQYLCGCQENNNAAWT